MYYCVMNREDARKATFAPSGPSTAIISITNVSAPPNVFGSCGWLKDILHVKFSDVSAGVTNCMTEQDARLIASFAHEMYYMVERFIIHCEYGASRSPAIAAAIMFCMEGDDRQIWDNPQYAPNKTCYNLAVKALMDYKP